MNGANTFFTLLSKDVDFLDFLVYAPDSAPERMSPMTPKNAESFGKPTILSPTPTFPDTLSSFLAMSTTPGNLDPPPVKTIPAGRLPC